MTAINLIKFKFTEMALKRKLVTIAPKLLKQLRQIALFIQAKQNIKMWSGHLHDILFLFISKF